VRNAPYARVDPFVDIETYARLGVVEVRELEVLFQGVVGGGQERVSPGFLDGEDVVFLKPPISTTYLYYLSLLPISTVEGELGIAGFSINFFKDCGVSLWLVWL